MSKSVFAIMVVAVLFVLITRIFNHQSDAYILGQAKKEVSAKSYALKEALSYCESQTDSLYNSPDIEYRAGWDSAFVDIRGNHSSKHIFIERHGFVQALLFNGNELSLTYRYGKYMSVSFTYSDNEFRLSSLLYTYEQKKFLAERYADIRLSTDKNTFKKDTIIYPIDSSWLLIMKKHK